MAAPILGFIIIFLAIGSSPWFSWTDNALSDLGVGGFGSVVFNSGLVVTGSFMMLFFLGLNEVSRGNPVGRAGSYMFIAAASLLIGIGVFNETFGRVHYYISVGFFLSLHISMLMLGVNMFRKGVKNIGILSLTTGFITPIVWSLQWRGVAIPEAVSALAGGVWSFVLGLWMMTQKEGDEPRKLDHMS